jgi:hypothetical protein
LKYELIKHGFELLINCPPGDPAGQRADEPKNRTNQSTALIKRSSHRCIAGAIDGDCQLVVSAAQSGTDSSPAQTNAVATRITFNAAITAPSRLAGSGCLLGDLLKRAVPGLFFVICNHVTPL